MTGVWLEELRVVRYELKNEDLHVAVGLRVAELVEEVPSEQRHLARLLAPLCTEQNPHLVDRALDILHAGVGVDVVQLKLRRLSGDKGSFWAVRTSCACAAAKLTSVLRGRLLRWLGW